ncbi:MAG: hypothetical protein ABIP48_13955 [Planctomycetota bacterium]
MKEALRFSDAKSPLDARIARGRRELIGAFELVYRSYLAKGYVSPHSGGIIYREAFGLPASRTVVATTESAIVLGTLTVVGDNPAGIDIEITYPGEVRSLREEGRDLAEITCLAIRPTGEFARTAVFLALTRCMIHHAYREGFNDLLMAVHPRHYRFYRRYFRVLPLGPCRPHPFVRGNPSIGCRIDLDNLKQTVAPEMWHQYFAHPPPESDYTEPPIERADHSYFLGRSGITPRAEDRRWKKDAA